MLKRMNLSSAALFPGLDGFARSLGEHLFHFDELLKDPDFDELLKDLTRPQFRRNTARPPSKKRE
jgi:hypothetical protein